jgi:hypothetical protein
MLASIALVVFAWLTFGSASDDDCEPLIQLTTECFSRSSICPNKVPDFFEESKFGIRKIFL